MKTVLGTFLDRKRFRAPFSAGVQLFRSDA